MRLSPFLQHGHDILRRGVDVHARQQNHDGEEDEQQRHLLSLGGNLRDVILRRKLGRALADEHVQTPRQRQTGRDDPEAQTEVHAERGRTQRAASETSLRHAPAVDLTHGKHVQRLRHQAAPEVSTKKKKVCEEQTKQNGASVPKRRDRGTRNDAVVVKKEAFQKPKTRS